MTTICPTCDGQGELETGYSSMTPCIRCNGNGTLPHCPGCGETWEGEEEYCDDCRAENARDDMADTAYDLSVEDGL